MMHGTTNIKFIDAQQAKLAYRYKNTKRKLYKTNAAIWYNKIRSKAIANKKRNCCILLDLFHHYKAWCTEPQILKSAYRFQ